MRFFTAVFAFFISCFAHGETEIPTGSIADLQRALGRMADAIEAGRSINSVQTGNDIHRATEGVWEAMAEMPHTGVRHGRQFTGQRGTKPVYHFGPEMDVTVVDRQGNVVTERRPRFEVWIEKAVGESSRSQADQVVIDHRERRILVHDITARSINDPVVERADVRGEFYQRTVEHEGSSHIRRGLIRDHIQGIPGMPDYQVEVGTPPAQYYRTHMEAEARAGRGRGTNARLGIRDSGSSANRAARGVIFSILIGIAMGTFAPEASAAEAAMNDSASRDFENMMRFYIRGEHHRADRIMRFWRHADATIYAKNLFPNMTDGVAHTFAEEFLIPYLEELRDRTRHLHQERQQCIRAEHQERRRVARESEERLDRALEVARREIDQRFEPLLQRITQWRERLMEISQRRGDADLVSATGITSWEQLQQFSEQSSMIFRAIRLRHDSIRERLTEITPDRLDTFATEVNRAIGQSYTETWVFISMAVFWAQEDLRERQRAEKVALRNEYAERSQQLDESEADAWLELRREFVSREAVIDRSIRQRVESVYRTFAWESREFAELLQQLGGDAVRAARGMSAFEEPGTPINQLLEQRLFLDLEVLVYENVPNADRRYTDQIRISAIPSFETTQRTPNDSSDSDSGRIEILAVWIDGEQARVADLDQPLKEGARVRIWAAVISGDHPGEHDWPIGPPPVGGLHSRQFYWSFEGASPQQGGHLYEIMLPSIGDSLGRNRLLHVSHPSATDLERNLEIRANRTPVGCIDVPGTGYRGTPLSITWDIEDEDHYNTLTLHVDLGDGHIDRVNHDFGRDPLHGLRGDRANEVESSGSERLAGYVDVTWYEPGNKEVLFAWSDGQQSHQSTYSVEIAGNEPPVFRSIGITPTDGIEVGEAINVGYDAMDRDINDEIAFFLRLPSGLRVLELSPCRDTSDNGKTCTASLVADTDGVYTVRVIAQDMHGAEVFREVAITVGNPPLDCAAIDCDCSNVNFGLLTREYRAECRRNESALRQSCEANSGQIDAVCNSVTSGPGAWPR